MYFEKVLGGEKRVIIKFFPAFQILEIFLSFTVTLILHPFLLTIRGIKNAEMKKKKKEEKHVFKYTSWRTVCTHFHVSFWFWIKFLLQSSNFLVNILFWKDPGLVQTWHTAGRLAQGGKLLHFLACCRHNAVRIPLVLKNRKVLWYYTQYLLVC